MYRKTSLRTCWIEWNLIAGRGGGLLLEKNFMCKNIFDFEIICYDWARLNDHTICALCRKEAIFISCDTRLIFEQDFVIKTVMCKIFGILSCPRQSWWKKGGCRKLRSRKSSSYQRISYMTASAQLVKETGGFSKVVDIVTQFKGTIYTDHAGRNLLMFYYNNGSIDFSRFRFELSKQRA